MKNIKLSVKLSFTIVFILSFLVILAMSNFNTLNNVRDRSYNINNVARFADSVNNLRLSSFNYKVDPSQKNIDTTKKLLINLIHPLLMLKRQLLWLVVFRL